MTETKEPEGTGAASRRQPEAVLVEQLREGDQRAFLELFQRWHPTMIRVALNHVRERAVAEEVAQETWLHFMQQLGRFNGHSSLRTWAFRILVNRAINRGKKEHRAASLLRRTRQLSGSANAPATSDGRTGPARSVSSWATGGTAAKTPEQMLLMAEARTHLESAIRKLPDKQRLVLSLRDVQGWRSAEVCELLNITLENQRVLLHRARVKVRQALAQYLKRT